MSKKGKIPSLLTGSSGIPRKTTAGKKRSCNRCDQTLIKGDSCYEVPKPGGFRSHKTYCEKCFGQILEQTQIDLNKLKSEINL